MPSSSSTMPSYLTSQIRKAVGLLLWKCKNRASTRDKLNYEIFSILESKFLFGYDDQKLWLLKQITPSTSAATAIDVLSSAASFVPSGADVGSIGSTKRQKARIAGYFNVAAGTGVGGIFTAMLFSRRKAATGRSSARRTRGSFKQRKGSYWPPTVSDSVSLVRKFFRRGGDDGSSSFARMERAMKDAFTEGDRNLMLKDTLMPVLTLCYNLLLLPPPPASPSMILPI
ncbi:hypothetical protein MRB53_012264 [Persea americana]|uniref:Uncharacterized protein n=1 Tax=Persea americana TaxID=3435 RepID=A0ACC2LYI5_PERAE|nr:hypothetical protein MRB53_012264 [Persea americana]